MRFLKDLVRGKAGLKSNLQVKDIYNQKISKDIAENLRIINSLFSAMPDLVIQRFHSETW